MKLKTKNSKYEIIKEDNSYYVRYKGKPVECDITKKRLDKLREKYEF